MPLLSRPRVATAASPPGPVAHRTPEGRRIPRVGRVTGLDVARALAVFGMLGAHFGGVPADAGPLTVELARGWSTAAPPSSSQCSPGCRWRC